MRLRIVHQLALLLVAAVLLSVLAVGGFVAWNLKEGFSDYLRARDRELVDRFAAVVAARSGHDAAMAAMVPGTLPMREIMDEFMISAGMALPPRPSQGEPDSGGPRRPGPPRQGLDHRPPPDGITRRIQIVDANGSWVGGPQFRAEGRLLEAPVMLRGQMIARIRMLPSAEPEGVDLRFLRRQYVGLGIAGAVTLLLALLAAAITAPWMGGPLRTVQAATRRIAGGELEVVVPEAGSREMAELIGDVNRMAQSLKKLEGARRSWLAQISHELRTPLSVLLGELESIEDGARQPTVELLGRLRAEVLHLVRLVNDLHLLSMADLGALHCEFVQGDASAMLAQSAQRMAPRLQNAGLSLEVVPSVAVSVCWDFGRMEQLVRNLLENSLRYTTSPGKVRVQWALQGQWVELQVDDTPPGVSQDQLEQLFEPLFRADIARQRRSLPLDAAAGDRSAAMDSSTGASGLGLAICRAIVQAHGGQIRAAASPLGGLRISVTLPVEPAAS